MRVRDRGVVAAVVVVGVVSIGAAYGLRGSEWLMGLLLNCGVAMLLAWPLLLLGRRLAERVGDDIAVQVADATTEPAGSPDEALTPAAPATYKELSRVLRERGWVRSSQGARHDVWRKGRDRVVMSVSEEGRARHYYGRVLAQVQRGENPQGTRLPS